MKKAMFLIFFLSFPAAFGGMELVNVVEWGGPCAIATKEAPGDSEWVATNFIVGIKTYLIQSSTRAVLDSGITIHPHLTAGLPTSNYWKGDSLFAVYENKVFVYDLSNPLNPIYLFDFDIPSEIEDYHNIEPNSWGDSAIYVMSPGCNVYLYDPDSFRVGVFYRLAEWEFPYSDPYFNGFFASGFYLYFYSDRGFWISTGTDSIPDTIYTYNSLGFLPGEFNVSVNRNRILVSCFSWPSFVYAYQWDSDTLLGPIATGEVYYYGIQKTIPGRGSNEFWMYWGPQYTSNTIILGDTIISDRTITTMLTLRDFHSSSSNTYFSFWQVDNYATDNMPLLAMYADSSYPFCLEKIVPQNATGPLKPLPSGDLIYGGNPIRRIRLSNPINPHVVSSINPWSDSSVYILADEINHFSDTIVCCCIDSPPVFFDISDPDTFIQIFPSSNWIDNRLSHLYIQDSLVYNYDHNMIGREAGLTIYRRNGLNLTEIGDYDFFRLRAFFALESWALLTLDSVTEVWDVSELDSPVVDSFVTEGGILPTPQTYYNHIDNIYFMNYALRFDPTGPVLVSGELPEQFFNGIVDDSILYCCEGCSLISAYRIMPGLDSLEYLDGIEFKNIPCSIYGTFTYNPFWPIQFRDIVYLYKTGDYLYVATRVGILVIDVSDILLHVEEGQGNLKPYKLSLKVYPNPFNSECLIHGPESAEISIMSIDGRFIEKLTLDKTGLGRWNPSEECATGVYLFQLKSKKQNAKAVFIK